MKRVKYIGPLSAGKVLSNLGMGIGLLLIPLILWEGFIQNPHGMYLGRAEGWFWPILYCILLPILYGITGFISGAIAAIIYNILPGWLGSVEVELE
jgi:hypothetical protein